MGCIPSSNTLAALPEGLLHSFESYELFVGESKAGERWKTPLYFCTRYIKTKPKAVPCLRFWCVFSGVFHRFLLLIGGKILSSHCWRCIPASVCFGPFVVFWFSFCPGLLQGIPVGLPNILSICISAYLMYIYIYLMYIYIYIYTLT